MTSQLQFTVNANHFVHDGGFEAAVAFTQEADALGYDHLRLVDHVVGVVAEEHPDLPPTPYTHRSQFQEVFTFIAYLSAITSRIGFVTGVLGLPQRQTALVAKQAAQVDLMSKGRFTLGVGIGYNQIEFEAMGEDFSTRGARVEEQVEVLRALWTREVVDFEGRWHSLRRVNVNPLPVQRPIPIWMGAGRTAQPVPPPKVIDRIGRLADGFMPLFRIDEASGRLAEDEIDALARVRQVAAENGRDPDTLKLEIGLYPHGKTDQQVFDEMDYLDSIGVTHIHVRFPDRPLAEQLDFLRDFARLREAFHAR